MLIREKSESDTVACVELLLRVHERDRYPLRLPQNAQGFITTEHESAAWVAERDGRIVGHVALHHASGDPTLGAAQRATGLAADRLVVVSRLFTDPCLRRAGVGRALLRHATKYAESGGQRAVLDVGQSLTAPIALYEAEGWERVEALVLRLDQETLLELWVYLSPEPRSAKVARRAADGSPFTAT